MYVMTNKHKYQMGMGSRLEAATLKLQDAKVQSINNIFAHSISSSTI